MDDDLTLPDFLKISKEERSKVWEGKTLTDNRSFASTPVSRMLSSDAEAFRIEEEKRKKIKTQSRIGKMLMKKDTPNTKTHYWETLRNRWVPLRHYKPESKMKPNFDTMIGPDLVKVYNEMAVEAVKLGMEVSTTKRFATRVAGIKRCEELYKSICEKKGDEYTTSTSEGQDEAETTNHDEGNQQESDVAKTAKKVKTTKTAKPKTAKAAKADANPISVACGVRTGTNRERMLLCLHASLGKPVPLATLLKATYKGGEEPATNAAFLTIARDLPNILKKAKAPFEMVMEKTEKGMVYVLVKK